MYAVIYTTGFNKDLKSEDVQVKVYKIYKTKRAALLNTWKKNQMISHQVIGHHFYVYDQLNREFLSAHAA
jgi:ribosomal protein S19